MGQLISGRGGGANTVVYVATVEFRFGADVLTEKLVFDKTYETTGVGGSNLGIHGCYSLPPAQQHSFVRNLSSLFIKSIFPLRVAFEFGLGFDQILEKTYFFKYMELNVSEANAVFRHATPFSNIFFRGGGEGSHALKVEVRGISRL